MTDKDIISIFYNLPLRGIALIMTSRKSGPPNFVPVTCLGVLCVCHGVHHYVHVSVLSPLLHRGPSETFRDTASHDSHAESIIIFYGRACGAPFAITCSENTNLMACSVVIIHPCNGMCSPCHRLSHTHTHTHTSMESFKSVISGAI